MARQEIRKFSKSQSLSTCLETALRSFLLQQLNTDCGNRLYVTQNPCVLVSIRRWMLTQVKCLASLVSIAEKFKTLQSASLHEKGNSEKMKEAFN